MLVCEHVQRDTKNHIQQHALEHAIIRHQLLFICEQVRQISRYNSGYWVFYKVRNGCLIRCGETRGNPPDAADKDCTKIAHILNELCHDTDASDAGGYVPDICGPQTTISTTHCWQQPVWLSSPPTATHIVSITPHDNKQLNLVLNVYNQSHTFYNHDQLDHNYHLQTGEAANLLLNENYLT